MEIDRFDRQILRVLQQDGRISNQDLADRIGLSPSPCLRRVRTLEENGVISRTVKPTVPVTVEYALTEKGRAFDQALIAMKEWRNEWA